MHPDATREDARSEIPATDPRTCAACGADLPADPALEGVDRLLGTPGTFGVLICAQCGTGRTTPYLEESGLPALYEGDYLPTSDYRPHPVIARLGAVQRRMHQRRIVRRKPVSVVADTPGQGLDVGCGRGDLGAGLIAKGWRMSGLDPSPSACEEARRSGLDMQQATLSTASFPEGAAFDAVFFCHSLEHVVDPAADVVRAARLLRPGGHLVVEVPNFACWQRERFADRWFHLDLPRHRTHFTPDGLQRVAQRAGLEPVVIGTGTSAGGLVGTLQYEAFGEWKGTSPLANRVLVQVASLSRPPAALLDRARGGGDLLYLVARRPAT